MICVNRVTDKSSLLDFQRATAKSTACLGHLCIIRPLFSLHLSSFAQPLIHTTLYVECILASSLKSFLEKKQGMNE